jgi:general secretion pathway protein A
MYSAYFGLTSSPFSVTPDPRFLYLSDGHREALAHLLYGIGDGGGFVQLTGEVGTGKTTLCRCLLEQLPPEVDVALVLNPKLTDVELLAAVCDELGVQYPAPATSRKLLVDALYRHLLDAHGRGRRTVLILDEAQDLAPDVLEQIRLLTNLETSTQKLLQVILIGQPELIRLLDREDLRQLAQRVTARYHLLPFAEADSGAYVGHRLAIAGQKDPIFTGAALRAVHRASRGVPRVINAVCDRALLGAYARDERRVGARTVRRAAREVLRGWTSRRGGPSWHWAVAASAVILTGAWLLVAYAPTRLAVARLAAPLHLGSPVASAPSAGVPSSGPVTDSPANPPAAAAATTAEVKPAPPESNALGDVLSDSSLRSDRASAFASLYARWGLDYDAARHGLGCDRGRAAGLRCLFGSGTWGKLRRIDLPAIIELTAHSLDHRYATVVALDDRAVTLELGGRRYTAPLAEVDRYWDGPFIVLCKAPALAGPPIELGRRGKDVEWVRRRLGALDGAPASGKNRDLFDDELRARVIAFQRSRALVPDGIVGEETLVQLSFTPGDRSVPRLLPAGS